MGFFFNFNRVVTKWNVLGNDYRFKKQEITNLHEVLTEIECQISKVSPKGTKWSPTEKFYVFLTMCIIKIGLGDDTSTAPKYCTCYFDEDR